MSNRAQEIRWCGKASNHADASKLLKQPGDVSLIERGRPRWLLIRCPSGCGETISLNVDRHAGPAWRLYWRGSQLSVYPSVWMEEGCESHFIVWRSRVDWIGGDSLEEAEERLRADVLRVMDVSRLRSFSEIADELDQVPWDVLHACRKLVKDGRAIEGGDHERGSFRRSD